MGRYKRNTEGLIHGCGNGFDALVRFSATQIDASERIKVPKSFPASFLWRLLLLHIWVLGMLCPLSAQTVQASWSSLSELRNGQKIEVVDIGSKKHLGTFVNVSDSAITYQDQTGEHAIPQQDVRSVKVRENRGRLRNALIGAGVGAGAGAGITAAAWEDHGFLGGKGAGAAVGAVIGCVSGATVGALLPSHHLIYRAVSH